MNISFHFEEVSV